MRKKINCKHGLNEREEIQARRLKVKLIEGDKETHELLKKHMSEWIKSEGKEDFHEFIKKKNNILFSAWKRFSSETDNTFTKYFFDLF